MARSRGTRGRRAVCQSNLKQLGTGFQLYLYTWDDTYPWPYAAPYTPSTPPTWRARLLPFVGSKGVFECPSNTVYLERISPDLPAHAAQNPQKAQVLAEVGPRFCYAMNDDRFRVGPPVDYGKPPPPPRDVTHGSLSEPSHVILVAEVQNMGPGLAVHSLGSCLEQSTEHLRYLMPPYGCPYFAHSSDGTSSWLFCDGGVRALRVKDTLVPRTMWMDSSVPWEEVGIMSAQAEANRVARLLPRPWR